MAGDALHIGLPMPIARLAGDPHRRRWWNLGRPPGRTGRRGGSVDADPGGAAHGDSADEASLDA